jgi:hypothetical protein
VSRFASAVNGGGGAPSSLAASARAAIVEAPKRIADEGPEELPSGSFPTNISQGIGPLDPCCIAAGIGHWGLGEGAFLSAKALMESPYGKPL